MSDEISQVVQMEYQGVYYTLTGTVKVISYFAKAIKALGNFVYKKFENRPGNCSWARLQNLSDGIPPILEFPKEMLEEKYTFPGEKEPMSCFEHYCKEHKLHYCMLPDLNPNDDYIPIGVMAQDMAIHQEQIKAIMAQRIATQEKKQVDYDDKIGKLKEELANAKDEKTKKKLEEKIEKYEKAKEQNDSELNKSKEKLDKDNILEFSEYLKQGKNTNFEKDPEATLENMESIGIVKEFTPEECMFPIRDEALVPDSKEIYYTQRVSDGSFITIQRTFEKDEDGIISSTYRIRNTNDPEHITIFSDEGMSTDAFREKLPSILKESGMQQKAKTAALVNEEHLLRYKASLENFSRAPKKGAKEFSSKEAKEFVESEVKEAKIKKQYQESKKENFIVPIDQVMLNDKSQMTVQVEDGLIVGVDVTFLDDDKVQVTIKDQKVYDFIGQDGKEEKLDSEKIHEKFMKEDKVHAAAVSHSRK